MARLEDKILAALATGPKTSAELAALSGGAVSSMHRVTAMLAAQGIVDRELIRVGSQTHLRYTLAPVQRFLHDQEEAPVGNGKALRTGGFVIEQGTRKVYLLTAHRHVQHDTIGHRRTFGIGSGMALTERG